MDQLSYSSDEEFSLEELRALVDEALGLNGGADSSNVSAPSIPPVFSFGDTTLMEHLEGILIEYVVKEDIPMIIGQLRDRLYSGIKSQEIEELHSIAKNKITPNNAEVHMPLWNNRDPDIVFIGEKPVINFGENENIFLSELKSAGFSSSICSWSYLIRHDYRDMKEIDEESIRQWSSILFSELRIWKPKLIIPMGKTSTSLFVGGDFKMDEINGSGLWVGPWRIMPLMAYNYAIKANKVESLRGALETAYEICFGSFGKI